MSVRDRIDEAHLLFAAGKLEGALVLTCIGIAATSRKRYPNRNTHNDREAFEQFLIDERSKYLGGHEVRIEFQGELRTFENMVYKFVRNFLVHEAELEDHLSFEYGDYLLDKRGTSEFFTFSSELVSRLMWVVETSPENKGVFPTGSLDGLPTPIDLTNFLDLSYQFDDIHHRVFCSACSVVTVPGQDLSEEPITWVHFKGSQTCDGRTLHSQSLRIVVPVDYVTSAKPGPAYRKKRSRPTSPDVGVVPIGKVGPENPMSIDELKRVVESLQVPMVRELVTLERPYYKVTSANGDN